jgi:SAM-dependent methyltransferase
MKDIQCPICSKSNLTEHLWESRDADKLTIMQCRNCSHVFQKFDQFTDIYTDGEFSVLARGSSKIPDRKKIAALDEQAFSRYKFYSKYIQPATKTLDAGSSIGSFVHLMKLNGKEADGLEPDRHYASFSSEQYFIDQMNLFLEQCPAEKRYNLITSFHVIEHVTDPAVFIEKSAELLLENGRILLECPSWENRIFGSRKQTIWKPHLHYFTLKSLYFLLDKYFQIDAYGFRGSAIYMSGKKRATIKEHASISLSVGLHSAYGNFLRLITPGFFSKNHKLDLSRQLVVMSMASKKRLVEFVDRGLKYVLYKAKEYFYLKNELGKRGKPITHITNYKGWGNNAGDVVLSKCVRDTIKLQDSFKFNIVELKRAVDDNLISQINSSEYLVVGGGGLFLPDTNENTVSGWQWAIPEEQLNHIETPVILFAIGYNFFRGQEPTDLFQKSLNLILNKASFAGIRNFGSIHKINELTNNEFKDKISYQPCPTTIAGKLYPHYINSGKQSNLIGVNIAFDRYHMRFGHRIYTILDEIATVLKDLENRGFKILNICHISADERFTVVLDKHKINYRNIRLQYKFPDQVYSFYGKLDLVMGMRGHAQMIPFGVHTPIISLGTHDKMKWFLEDIESEDWYIDLNDEKIISRLLAEKVDYVLQNRKMIKNRISEKQELLYNITLKNIGKAFNK